MSITKIDSALLSTSGASDGDVLTYVSANSSVEFKAVDASGSANLVEANLDAYASYANSTFATDTNLNTVSSNAATNTSSITALNAEVDQLGSYANSTFATATNLNTVSSNAATNASSITALNAEVDQLGSYANSTFATATNLNTVQSNVTSVGGELDAFGTYANATFSTGTGNTQVYVGSTLVTNTAILLGAGNGINLAANTTSKTVTITTNMANITSQVIATDGSANAFTVSKAASNANMLLVSVNGLLLNPTEYTISSTTLTLANTDPLIAGSNVEVRYFDFFQFGGVSAGGGGSPAYSYQGSTTGYWLGGTGAVSDVITKFAVSSETASASPATLHSPALQIPRVNAPSNSGYIHYIPSVNPTADVYAIATASDTPASPLSISTDTANPYAAGQVSLTSSGENGYVIGLFTDTDGIEKFAFSSSAPVTTAGNLVATSAYKEIGMHSDITNSYGYGVGGIGAPARVDTIQKFPFSSDSNSIDIGELVVNRSSATTMSSTTFGYVYSGATELPYSTGYDGIEKFPFSSNTPATDIAEIAHDYRRAVSGVSTPSAGYVGSGIPTAPPYSVPSPANVYKLPFVSDTTVSDIGEYTTGIWNAASGQV